MSKKLFVYSRGLPKPYDTLRNKKVPVASQYSNIASSSLCVGAIKAIHAFLDMDTHAEGGLGLSGNKGIVEYKSSETDMYHLVVYDPSTGHHIAGVYNESTETMEQYIVGDKARDGAALLLALMPDFLQDTEFCENLELYKTEYISGLTDIATASRYLALLCDNMYRRAIDDTCPAHVKTQVDNSGNINRLSRTHVDAGRFIPDRVLTGQFKILGNTKAVTTTAAPIEIEHSDFEGKYKLNELRPFSFTEASLIPKLEPWYVLPKEAALICQHAQLTTDSNYPMRNFMLRGPAGTGKTMAAQAIAAGLGLPYMKYTCSANTEIYDFVGQVFPDSAAPSTGDENLDKERAELESMGGINFGNVVRLLGLPAVDDMEYDPEGSYQSLTGIAKPAASCQDCVSALMHIVTEKIAQLNSVQAESSKDTQTYRYVETDFIKALKYGYLVEIQEPTTIMQPGVLVGLNSLLEQGGSITLPTGEIITRHPDAVVVITTNMTYEGCRGMNQSATDRMSLIHEIDMPTPEIMAQRAVKITGFEDEYMVEQMARVINDLDAYCRSNGITDGSVGMRGLLDWVLSTKITDNPYESAKSTIVGKAASNAEDQDAILTAIIEPQFSPMRTS